MTKLLIIAVVLMMIPATLWAQKDNKSNSAVSSMYLISAKAGAVNFVTGSVTLTRADGKKGALQKGDTVEVGDIVSTSADGKVEILLNPGSYIRLAGNSEFEFLTTSLDDLQLKVNRGSAMFEVIADKDFTVTVKTPDARFYLITAGVFRLDVTENGGGKISIWKGKAQVGDLKATVVKGGKTASLENGQIAIVKFDRDQKGEFENWSRDRAKEIAKVNAKLQQRQMNQSLISSFGNNGWNINGYGLWVRDPWSQSFCFLPFSWGWSSPYGFGYRQSIWSYSLPLQIVAPIYQNQVINNPSSSNTVMTPPSAMPSNNPSSVPVNNSLPPARSVESPQSRPTIVERKGRPDND